MKTKKKKQKMHYSKERNVLEYNVRTEKRNEKLKILLLLCGKEHVSRNDDGCNFIGVQKRIFFLSGWGVG